MIHAAKGFSIVNEAETGVFLEVFCFFNDPTDVGNLISGFYIYIPQSLDPPSGNVPYIFFQKKVEKSINLQ